MQKLQNTFVTFCAKCAEKFFKRKAIAKRKVFCIEPLQFSFLSNKKPAKLIFCQNFAHKGTTKEIRCQLRKKEIPENE